MKLFILLILCCGLTGCTNSDNTFYLDTKCDGEPFFVRRFIVDKERQTVLYQFASTYKGEVKEILAQYLDNCNITDSKNFICGRYSDYSTTLSNGQLIETEMGSQIELQDCVYTKGIFGYKKIAEATVTDAKTPPSQNK